MRLKRLSQRRRIITGVVLPLTFALFAAACDKAPREMEFAMLPGGEFVMGDVAGRGEPDEYPLRTVRVSPFMLQTTEVTRAQWQAMMGARPWAGRGAPPQEQCPDCPATMVSWDDAQEYIRRLNAVNGHRKFRLPSEAEWEYACRGGRGGTYPFEGGPEDAADHARFGHGGGQGGGVRPVAQGDATDWDLLDMAGNVWEWCADRYAASYAKGQTDNPKGPETGKMRTVRGGSWRSGARHLRCANRMGLAPSLALDDVGFRLARDP